MAKKIDLGTKPDYTVMPKEMTKGKSPTYYPSFYVDNKELPLKGEDVGNEITAVVTLKLKGFNDSTNDGDKRRKLNYRFDVLDIQFNTDNSHSTASPVLDAKINM